MKRLAWLFGAVFLALSACDLYTYGQLGGADQTGTFYPGEQRFESIMSSLSGVWYSRYAGMGRLDGYRIGKWDGRNSFGELVEDSGKTALFPALATPYKTYTDESGSDSPAAGDYFVLYDDTVYGQKNDAGPPGAGWNFAYLGIVRAVNVFAGDPNRGAVIIEYLKGGAPRWLDRWPESSNGNRPFFGIYYRVLTGDTVQMANAVDLAAMYNGQPYYTETAHLAEAVAKNNAENEAEFISWGAVIPQDRE